MRQGAVSRTGQLGKEKQLGDVKFVVIVWWTFPRIWFEIVLWCFQCIEVSVWGMALVCQRLPRRRRRLNGDSIPRNSIRGLRNERPIHRADGYESVSSIQNGIRINGTEDMSIRRIRSSNRSMKAVAVIERLEEWVMVMVRRVRVQGSTYLPCRLRTEGKGEIAPPSHLPAQHHPLLQATTAAETQIPSPSDFPLRLQIISFLAFSSSSI